MTPFSFLFILYFLPGRESLAFDKLPCLSFGLPLHTKDRGKGSEPFGPGGSCGRFTSENTSGRALQNKSMGSILRLSTDTLKSSTQTPDCYLHCSCIKSHKAKLLKFLFPCQPYKQQKLRFGVVSLCGLKEVTILHDNHFHIQMRTAQTVAFI